MRILTLNTGSSSIKCVVLDSDSLQRLFEINAVAVGTPAGRLVGTTETAITPPTYDAAIAAILAAVQQHASELKIDAIAHRVVHGGSQFVEPILIDAAVLATLSELSVLAPLHNPAALAAIRAAQAAFPNLPQVAVFDTAFHRTLPKRSREYALPSDLSRDYALRRFGFHGLSHAHVMHAVAEHLRSTPQQLRIISCHLGNGASVAAIEYGASVDTSMGMTPLEGLVMGTRGGDLDPGILLYLLQSKNFNADSLEQLLNNESGLVGLTGTTDFAQIEQRAAQSDETCRQAIALYAHRIRKYIGAYAAVMGGVDAIAFTGGVGEHSALLRHRSTQRLEFFGAVLDEDRNRDVQLSTEQPLAEFSTEVSRVKLFAIRADEALQLTRETTALLKQTPNSQALRIPVAVSARHAHLSVGTIEKLFGSGYQLKPRTELSQVGQFSAQETINLIGPRGTLENVRLMGPPRASDQVEVSRNDEFLLGVDAPVRVSGDLANTPGITLVGPLGKVTIEHGVICARRHIHMNTADAQRFGLHDHDTVAVSIDSEGRDLTFDDVIVRVSPDFRLELHLDTDEANAAGVKPHQFAELVASIHTRPTTVARRQKM